MILGCKNLHARSSPQHFFAGRPLFGAWYGSPRYRREVWIPQGYAWRGLTRNALSQLDALGVESIAPSEVSARSKGLTARCPNRYDCSCPPCVSLHAFLCAELAWLAEHAP